MLVAVPDLAQDQVRVDGDFIRPLAPVDGQVRREQRGTAADGEVVGLVAECQLQDGDAGVVDARRAHAQSAQGLWGQGPGLGHEAARVIHFQSIVAVAGHGQLPLDRVQPAAAQRRQAAHADAVDARLAAGIDQQRALGGLDVDRIRPGVDGQGRRSRVGALDGEVVAARAEVDVQELEVAIAEAAAGAEDAGDVLDRRVGEPADVRFGVARIVDAQGVLMVAAFDREQGMNMVEDAPGVLRIPTGRRIAADRNHRMTANLDEIVSIRGQDRTTGSRRDVRQADNVGVVARLDLDHLFQGVGVGNRTAEVSGNQATEIDDRTDAGIGIRRRLVTSDDDRCARVDLAGHAGRRQIARHQHVVAGMDRDGRGRTDLRTGGTYHRTVEHDQILAGGRRIRHGQRHTAVGRFDHAHPQGAIGRFSNHFGQVDRAVGVAVEEAVRQAGQHDVAENAHLAGRRAAAGRSAALEGDISAGLDSSNLAAVRAGELVGRTDRGRTRTLQSQVDQRRRAAPRRRPVIDHGRDTRGDGERGRRHRDDRRIGRG